MKSLRWSTPLACYGPDDGRPDGRCGRPWLPGEDGDGRWFLLLRRSPQLEFHLQWDSLCPDCANRALAAIGPGEEMWRVRWRGHAAPP